MRNLPASEIIILTAPAKIQITEAVDHFKMLSTNRCHTAQDLLVGQLVVERVHVTGHVSRVEGTMVQVSVVFGHQVNVMKHKTVPLVVLHGLGVADIHQFSSIERYVRRLD
jgi:hypothetical protein